MCKRWPAGWPGSTGPRRGGEHISHFGRFDVVAGNSRENFTQMAGQVGVTVRQPVYDRVCELTERALADLQPLIETRAERGLPCDTHGDLHLVARLPVPRSAAAGRSGHHRLHRVQRALPIRRPGG